MASKVDLKYEERIRSLEDVISMLQNDIAALKTRYGIVETVRATLADLQSRQTNQYADLNDKISSIRGMMAVNSRQDRNKGAAAQPSVGIVEVDMHIEKLYSTGAITKAQYDSMYQAKALMQTFANISPAAESTGPRHEIAEKQGNDTATNLPAAPQRLAQIGTNLKKKRA